MPRRAAIINDQKLLVEFLTGEISAASLALGIEKTLDMPGFHVSINQLVIVGASATLKITNDQIRSFASLKPIFDLTSRRAYCVFDNDHVFGTLRMFEMERAESSGHISVYRTLAEACEKVEIKPSLVIELWPEIWGLD